MESPRHLELPILRVRKLKPKRVSGSLLPVALLLVGTVVKLHNLGSYCHISMRRGLGRSDAGYKKDGKEPGHCLRESSETGSLQAYKGGHQHPEG